MWIHLYYLNPPVSAVKLSSVDWSAVRKRSGTTGSSPCCGVITLTYNFGQYFIVWTQEHPVCQRRPGDNGTSVGNVSDSVLIISDHLFYNSLNYGEPIHQFINNTWKRTWRPPKTTMTQVVTCVKKGTFTWSNRFHQQLKTSLTDHC